MFQLPFWPSLLRPVQFDHLCFNKKMFCDISTPNIKTNTAVPAPGALPEMFWKPVPAPSAVGGISSMPRWPLVNQPGHKQPQRSPTKQPTVAFHCQVTGRSLIAPHKIGPLRDVPYLLIVPELVAQDLPWRIKLQIQPSGAKSAIINANGIGVKVTLRFSDHQQIATPASQQVLGEDTKKWSRVSQFFCPVESFQK